MSNTVQFHQQRLKRQLKPIAMTGNQMLTIPPQWIQPILAYDELMRAVGRPASTRYLRIYHLRRFACDHPHTEPYEVTEDHLIVWMAAHEWAPETRRSWRASLRCFYSWAHAKGYMRCDPSFGIPGITPPPPTPRPAPDDVVDDALRNESLRIRIAILILTLTGMRRHEAAKLHTDDLEWGGDGWAFRIVGKGGRVRMIPVDDQLAAVVLALPRGYIFPGNIDGHLSPSYLGKIVSGALPPGWTAHNLRHRYASLAYSVERDIRAVQELLGHAKVTTTQIYTFIPPSSLRKAAAGARLGLTAA